LTALPLSRAGPAPELPDWLARLVPFERSVLHAGGMKVHVMQSGRGRPVLLVHGNPTWGFLWRKVATALADEPLRLVMPDLVGLGLSDKPRDPAWHTLDNHAAALGAVIDALDLENVIVAAQDWGGPIALRALADRPGRLGGLLLANTVVGPPRPDFRPKAFHRLAKVPLLSDLLFRGLGFPQNILGRVQGDRASISGEIARAYTWPLRHRADRVAPLALARMVPDSQSHPSVPALARAQEVVTAWRGPAELVWGVRDPILGRVHAHVARLLPQARSTLTQAGHFLQEEVPTELAAAIRRLAAV
jgi:cis-3-alkyl-4-acyloxetan-2-one decarboxylase